MARVTNTSIQAKLVISVSGHPLWILLNVLLTHSSEHKRALDNGCQVQHGHDGDCGKSVCATLARRECQIVCPIMWLAQSMCRKMLH